MVDQISSVRGFVDNSSPDRVAAFSASCAERVRQVFVGLVSLEGDREGDLDRIVQIVDSLWEVGSDGSWDGDLQFLGGLPEIKKGERGSGKDGVLYAAAMTIFHAVKYRKLKAPEDAVECSVFALSAASLMSRYLGSEVDAGEFEIKRRESDMGFLAKGNPFEGLGLAAMRIRSEEFSADQLRGEFY